MKTVTITSTLVTFHDRGQPVLSADARILDGSVRHLLVTVIRIWTQGEVGGAWLVDSLALVEQRYRVATLGTKGLTPIEP